MKLLLEFYDKMKKKCYSFWDYIFDKKITRYIIYLLLTIAFFFVMKKEFKEDKEDLLDYIDFFKEIWN